jgi:hypothetical protein
LCSKELRHSCIDGHYIAFSIAVKLVFLVLAIFGYTSL